MDRSLSVYITGCCNKRKFPTFSDIGEFYNVSSKDLGLLRFGLESMVYAFLQWGSSKRWTTQETSETLAGNEELLDFMVAVRSMNAKSAKPTGPRSAKKCHYH